MHTASLNSPNSRATCSSTFNTCTSLYNHQHSVPTIASTSPFSPRHSTIASLRTLPSASNPNSTIPDRAASPVPSTASPPQSPPQRTSTSSGLLHVAHVNICSLRNKVTDISELLIEHNIDIIAITETWLDSSITDSSVHIPQFTLYRHDRQTGRGGGVCFYVRDSLKVVQQYPCPAVGVEALFIKLCPSNRNNATSLAIGCIYRPPSTPVSFWHTLQHQVDDVLRQMHAQPILLGDFNVNVLKSQSTNYTHLQQFCDSLSLRNVVNEPTRFLSNACLDLVLLPKAFAADMTFSNSCVFSMDSVTDHCLVTATLTTPSHNNLHRILSSHRMVRKPPLAKMDQEKFGQLFSRSSSRRHRVA